MNLVRDITVGDLRERVKSNVREAMVVAGTTQAKVAEEIAEETGVSKGSAERQMRRVCAGEKLGLESLLPVARVLGVDVSALVGRRVSA